jgi:hypothetical protein
MILKVVREALGSEISPITPTTNKNGELKKVHQINVDGDNRKKDVSKFSFFDK